MNVTRTTNRRKNATPTVPEGVPASTPMETANAALPGGGSAAGAADGPSRDSPSRLRHAVPPLKAARPAAAATTKGEIMLKKLRAARGASIDMLVEATGWQAHSVRGFLSAIVRKKLGLTVESDVGKDGVRRYRIVGQAA